MTDNLTVSSEFAGDLIGRYVRFTHSDGWEDWTVEGWLHKVELPERPLEFVYLSVSDNRVEASVDGLGGYGFWPGRTIEFEFPAPLVPAAEDVDE